MCAPPVGFRSGRLAWRWTAGPIAARGVPSAGRVAAPMIYPKPEVTMRAQSPAQRRVRTNDGKVPMTPEAFRWLEIEVDRLAAAADGQSATAWLKSVSGDSDAPTFIANGEFDVLLRRLAKLRAAMTLSRVAQPDGSVMIGTSVTVRTEDGSIESYRVVAPGAADTRDRSISCESPVGAALMGRRYGDTVHVETPAGALQFQVERVEEL
jgi:transcription elongation factor GreA